ncbi:hypothetical protein GGX14DRAFT_409201 [Mycena pura]|uniref:Uncharacterized protein n=1 Tax=Mycena pura TaxID=153505 RepID=A0AAD6UP37_9AGAR|nr:hypothetical protein GGX14DRAFT_409201 [Mycena pura]
MRVDESPLFPNSFMSIPEDLPTPARAAHVPPHMNVTIPAYKRRCWPPRPELIVRRWRLDRDAASNIPKIWTPQQHAKVRLNRQNVNPRQRTNGERRTGGGSWPTGSYGGSGGHAARSGMRHAACGVRRAADGKQPGLVRRSAKARGVAGNRQQLATSELRTASSGAGGYSTRARTVTGRSRAGDGAGRCQLPADGGCGEERAASTVRRTVCGKWVASGGKWEPVHGWRQAPSGKRVARGERARQRTRTAPPELSPASPTGSVDAHARKAFARRREGRSASRSRCSVGAACAACAVGGGERSAAGGQQRPAGSRRERECGRGGRKLNSPPQSYLFGHKHVTTLVRFWIFEARTPRKIWIFEGKFGPFGRTTLWWSFTGPGSSRISQSLTFPMSSTQSTYSRDLALLPLFSTTNGKDTRRHPSSHPRLHSAAVDTASGLAVVQGGDNANSMLTLLMYRLGMIVLRTPLDARNPRCRWPVTSGIGGNSDKHLFLGSCYRPGAVYVFRPNRDISNGNTLAAHRLSWLATSRDRRTTATAPAVDFCPRRSKGTFLRVPSRGLEVRETTSPLPLSAPPFLRARLTKKCSTRSWAAAPPPSSPPSSRFGPVWAFHWSLEVNISAFPQGLFLTLPRRRRRRRRALTDLTHFLQLEPRALGTPSTLTVWARAAGCMEVPQR